MAVPGGETESERWSSQDQFLIVVDTAAMNELERAEYCRLKGLYVEQVEAWRDDMIREDQRPHAVRPTPRNKLSEMVLYSRKIVACDVWPVESATNASQLVTRFVR
jgi:hypothetical protein